MFICKKRERARKECRGDARADDARADELFLAKLQGNANVFLPYDAFPNATHVDWKKLAYFDPFLIFPRRRSIMASLVNN